jgi:hypothetical protein
MNSNQPVPIRSQPVTVALLDAGGATLSSAQLITDANGNASVPDNASAQGIQIIDQFGNVGTGSIQ